MWMLHVVVVHGGTGWPAALLFGLTACLTGWLFAWLAAETRDEAALTLDLALAGLGALLGQGAAAAARTDPLATVFGVHLFSVALGALLLLSLVHDLCATERLAPRLRPLHARGGLLCTFLGLSSWPPDAWPCAIYGDGLRIALLPAGAPTTLLYEQRHGPLRGTRRLALPPGAAAQVEGDVLSVSTPEAGTLLRLEGVRVIDAAEPAIATLVSQNSRIASPFPPGRGKGAGG